MIDSLANKFFKNGYKVFRNLEYKDRERIVGEIDLLAIDTENKEAIMFEMKTHHKPKQYLKAINQLHKSEKALRSLLEIKLDRVYKVYYSNEIQRVII